MKTLYSVLNFVNPPFSGLFKLALLICLVLGFIPSISSQSMPVRLYRKVGSQFKPSGSGAVVAGGRFVLTTAHLITNPMAKKEVSIETQLRELNKIGVTFLSEKVNCKSQEHGFNFIDGAILVPMGYFECHVLDVGINPVKICNNINCFDDTYTYSSKTGFKGDVLNYLGMRSFQKGDSGSVVATKAYNDVVAVFYGHGTTEIAKNGYPTSYFFMLDNRPGLAAISRISVGKTQIKRAFPQGCTPYQ